MPSEVEIWPGVGKAWWGDLQLPGKMYDRNPNKTGQKAFPVFLADRKFGVETPYLHIVENDSVIVQTTRLTVESFIGQLSKTFPFIKLKIQRGHDFDKLIKCCCILFNMRMNRPNLDHEHYSGCGCNLTHCCTNLCVHMGPKFYRRERQSLRFNAGKNDLKDRREIWEQELPAAKKLAKKRTISLNFFRRAPYARVHWVHAVTGRFSVQTPS